MKKYLIYSLICIIFNSCSSSTKQTKENESGIPKIIEGQKSRLTLNIIEKLDVFSECTKYDNNLSTLASKVKFIHLDVVPPINDFHTYDVAISKDYIFLSGMTNIVQYDHTGKFIKNIGRLGRGPKEFLQLFPPLQLDRENKLLYALDSKLDKIMVYHFDGTYKKTIPLKSKDGCIQIIDSSLMAIRQMYYNRYLPDCKSIRFINYNGREVKTYPSHLYPIPKEKFKRYGAEESFLWSHNEVLYSLEYGADTIFQIIKDSLAPVRVLTGKLKLDKDEFFIEEQGEKLNLLPYLFRPNSGIFESETHIIFRLSNKKERFFMVYDKLTMQFHRTFHKNAPTTRKGILKMEYFMDDMVSGLPFNPQYQSHGKAMSLIPATDIYKVKEEILNFIANHPSEEAEKLKSIVQNINEMDNPILMIVNFK